MCGIAGFIINPADEWLPLGRIVKRLGLGIEPRGDDATGVGIVTRRGKVKIRKRDESATAFFARHDGIGDNAHIAIIHTRNGTQGSATNPLNNHPVVSGNIVSIHNGVIYNDDSLFKTHGWKRHGQVDSEAISAALDNMAIVPALEALEGWMAIAWIDKVNPKVLHLARGHSSPLEWGMTRGGSFFFASTRKVLESIEPFLFMCGEQRDDGTYKNGFVKESFFDEGQYASVWIGERDETLFTNLRFKPQEGYSRYVGYGSNAWKSQGGGWAADESGYTWKGKDDSEYEAVSTTNASGAKVTTFRKRTEPKTAAQLAHEARLEAEEDAAIREQLAALGVTDPFEQDYEPDMDDLGIPLWQTYDRVEYKGFTGTVVWAEGEVVWVEWDDCEVDPRLLNEAHRPAVKREAEVHQLALPAARTAEERTEDILSNGI